jgi:preprotein translocase subunit YajC
VLKMARPEVDNNKYIQVKMLNEGDIIQLTTGQKVLFERCKQKDFIGIMDDGKRYSIFINKFDKVLEKCNMTVKSQSNSNNKEMEVKTLSFGDKVKLTNGEIAEVIKVNQKRFVGVINGSEYTIPFGMFESVIEKSKGIAATKTSNRNGFKYTFWVHGTGDDFQVSTKSIEQLEPKKIEEIKAEIKRRYNADYVENPVCKAM